MQTKRRSLGKGSAMLVITLAPCLAPGLVAAQVQAQAQSDAQSQLPTVTVTASPFSGSEAAQILAPAKVLIGDELRDKLGGTLGETLSKELGVSASGFGAGASRPIIRGLEGPRVQILQNGMGVADVSSISNDHGVASELTDARQIEILRGPAALLYGSGASGGLVNIVNDKIATELPDRLSALAEARYNSVDNGKAASAEIDSASGPVAIHVDASANRAGDYAIPGYREMGGPSANWAVKGNTTTANTLPNSFSNKNSFGAGASYVSASGFTGVSVEQFNQKYGIPSFDGSQIDQTQNRFDFSHLSRAPFSNFESLKLKAAYTDYQHTESQVDGTPTTLFLNKALDGRVELAHLPWMGWRGTFGAQATSVRFSATDISNPGHAAIIPPTNSRTVAGFVVEEKTFGPVIVDLGARVEQVNRSPDASVPYTDTASFTNPAAPTAQERNFGLYSWSAGASWAFSPGYSTGLTYSVAQRAPSAEELYSFGAHDATVTFDVGNSNFQNETAQNIELSMQKTLGLVRWRANLFQNQVKNFIYGAYPGLIDTNSGNQVRQFTQADATIRGAEAELTYNWHQPGYSTRGFADPSQGTLGGGGNLPLQAATDRKSGV